ncbi:hypothetical protein C8F01DRAFT_1104511 [Mycena amicta]|nr:hypothetical protein C8F01DRAFT_1104511 [Mycena amicta]
MSLPFALPNAIRPFDGQRRPLPAAILPASNTSRTTTSPRYPLLPHPYLRSVRRRRTTVRLPTNASVATPSARTPSSAFNLRFPCHLCHRPLPEFPSSLPRYPRRECMVPAESGSRERREERKVTFNEACDVEELASEEGNSGEIDPDSTPEDPFFVQPQQNAPPPHDSSYESVDLSDTSMLPDTSMPLELDPDASITGIVDAITPPPPQLGSAHTRTYEYDHPTDLDTEEGVPFGRSHHADRAAAFHTHQGHPPPIPQLQLSGSRPLPLTPPRPSDIYSSPPLATEDQTPDEEVARDVARLPGSPSPAHEIGVPRFSLPSGKILVAVPVPVTDPFALPRLRDEPLPEARDDSHDLSLRRSQSDQLFSENGSPGTTSVDSPGYNQVHGSGGRPRISREEVQRRMRARSATPELEDAQPVKAMDVVAGEISREHSSVQDESTMQEEDEFKEEREEEARWERAHEEEREGSASSEIAVIETAERLVLHSPHDEEPALSPGLGLDFGTRFGMGMLGIPGLSGSVNSRMSRSESVRAAERLEPERMSVDMDTRSALDRLLDDVAGVGGYQGPDDSVCTEDADDFPTIVNARPITRAATDSALLQMGNGVGAGAGLSRTVSVASSSSLLSLPPPPRREMRRFDEEGYDYVAPPAEENRYLRAGRPSARRSMSTGDVEDLAQMRNQGLLDKEDLGATIQKELSKRDEPQKRKYNVREREGLIYASSSENDRISHLAGAGDLDAGKAWRTVRRPSDMNEYSKQIKEYRAQQNPGKAYGKVFVKVVGIKGIHLPLPNEPTALTCTLNNGIHFVTTPEFTMSSNCTIDQEFELIEHSKLEFTLTIKVRRDPHIAKQFKSLTPVPTPIAPPPPPPVVQQSSSKGGKRSFWSSSPKKSKDKAPPPQPQPVVIPVAPQGPLRLPENLARYLKPDGTLARSFISFKDVAQRCDTRLFESSFPLIGQRLELGGKSSTLQVGELILHIFRLPPLSGAPQDQLPQSLDECLRGLRHINWHKVTYFQGTLTQNGGDCSSWRRRQLRVVGSSLIAFNDVTKKATATIDLKKAIAVEDDQEARGAMSPASAMTGRSSRYDDHDGLYGVERSFRLIFPNDQEISFFADTDEEKSKWLEILRALVGHIPPHPLWAELLWQRNEELSRRAAHSGP